MYESNPGYATGVVRRIAGMTGDDSMENGDVALILGSGTVLDLAKIGDYEYHKEGLPEAESHTYWRHVDYYGIGPIRIRDLPIKFHQGGEASLHSSSTLISYDIDKESLDELISIMDELETVELEEGLIDFSEDSIQKYIANNYKELDGNIITVKREYSTRVGDIDIFGEEENGNYIVIEIKTGTAQDSSVGQILGYMNSLRADDIKVRGILVAEDFTERVKEAVRSDDISLVRFKTKLDFIKIK